MFKINDKIIAFLPPETIEAEAMQQIENTSSVPVLFRHVAVMPDTHYGKGSTVGTVLATEGAVIPAAVGVDIGCGMIAVKTTLKSADIKDKLHDIRIGIERRVPMSMGKFMDKISDTAAIAVAELEGRAAASFGDVGHPMPKTGIDYYDAISPNWRFQLGTLGGGNHFIEICLDTEDNVWVTLHSGSRGVGNRIGNMHIKEAQRLMEQYKVKLADTDLAYLPEGTPEFNAYIRDLDWAQQFALLNREEMLNKVMAQIAESVLGDYKRASELEFERINCHHNFCQIENHFDKNVWITRKGAIQASEGMRGMIPGSMGTRSYIVSGLANKMSYNSAPHGAGRRMSRGKAQKQFGMADLEKAMEGIEHRSSETLIDEIPQAYKDIDVVMENAKELVKIDAVLKQIMNVKGD